MNHYSDADLLLHYDRDDGDLCFAELVRRLAPSLRKFLHPILKRSDLIDDVLQETFIQIIISRECFNQNKPLRPWVYKIARNKANDTLRKMQRRPVLFFSSMAEYANDGTPTSFTMDDVASRFVGCGPDESFAITERVVRVRAIVAKMPENLRAILILGYFEQYSYKHMAEILSIPIGTVKSRLHTAVKYFGQEWIRKYGCP